MLEENPLRRTVLKATATIGGVAGIASIGTKAVTDLRQIAYGDTEAGEIDDADPVDPEYNGEYYAEPVNFSGDEGDEISVVMSPETLSGSWIRVEGPSNPELYGYGNNSGETTASVTLENSGQHTIWAGSYHENSFGSYELSLSKSGQQSNSPEDDETSEYDGNEDTPEEPPYEVTATPLAASDERALFEIEVEGSGLVESGYVGPLEIRTESKDFYINRVIPVPEDDGGTETLEAAGEIGIAVAGAVGGPIATGLSAGVSITQTVLEFNDEHPEGVNYLEFSGQYEDVFTGHTKHIIELKSDYGEIDDWGPKMGYEYKPEDDPTDTLLYSPVLALPTFETDEF